MHDDSKRTGATARPPIEAVLLTVPYSDGEIAQLAAAFAPARVITVPADDHAGIEAALAVADVAVLQGDADERFLNGRLRWIHCDHSGLNKTARPEFVAADVIVTGAAGRSAPALAQHVFYFALALTHDTVGLLDAQRRHVWRGIPGYERRHALWGKTLGIIGLGKTGEEVAALGKAFGMTVLAYRRSDAPAPACVDRLYCAARGESIDRLLEESDVVVLATKLTDETHHLIGADQLHRMKPTAYLVNISRGAVIDEPALVEALHAGEIAGAGLDVFEEEPLPEDAAIWDAPHVLITPHMTPRMPDRTQRSVDIVVENLRRYRAGEELLNMLTASDLYTGKAAAGR